MPKQGQRAEINTFIQGLITEASPLNFPPNASKQEENFELYRDGSRSRRLGIDVINPNLLVETELDALNVNIGFKHSGFYWKNVSGDPDREFLVIKAGTLLYFFNPELLTFIANYSVPEIDSAIDVSFTSCDGKLIVAAKDGRREIAAIEYSTISNTFSHQVFSLKVRDFWGIEVPDTNTENDRFDRPVVLSEEHKYNLHNQSWGIVRKDPTGLLTNPIGIYYNEYNKYPSNSELVWTGLQFQPVESGSTPYERIYPNLYEEVFGSEPQAPSGYFVIDLINRGASRLEESIKNNTRASGGLGTITLDPPTDRTEGGPSIVCEYAGRLFYSGINGQVFDGDKRSPNLSNYVLFSQLIKSSQDFEKCYQEGDPTSREGSDIVDTDGGFIPIAGSKNTVAMITMGSNLLVIADNGVWAISGGSDFGFTASTYKVDKLTSFGALSDSSVVVHGDACTYWGLSGIYTISPDKNGNLSVNNIAQITIQKLYNSIPKLSRTSATGEFDEFSKKIRWTYKEGDYFSSDSNTKELILDLTLNSFSMNTIKNINPNSIEIMFPVFVGDRMLYPALTTTVGDNEKYTITLCDYINTEFIDWKSRDGVGMDAKAFVLSGAQIAGDSAIEKQTPYLIIHFRKTETTSNELGQPLNQSGCQFNTYWDWAVDVKSHKVSSLTQAYRYRKPYAGVIPEYDNGFEVVSTKNKVRGRGRSFALYFETEPLKDCNILGWNLSINGNAIA